MINLRLHYISQYENIPEPIYESNYWQSFHNGQNLDSMGPEFWLIIINFSYYNQIIYEHKNNNFRTN